MLTPVKLQFGAPLGAVALAKIKAVPGFLPVMVKPLTVATKVSLLVTTGLVQSEGMETWAVWHTLKVEGFTNICGPAGQTAGGGAEQSLTLKDHVLETPASLEVLPMVAIFAQFSLISNELQAKPSPVQKPLPSVLLP